MPGLARAQGTEWSEATVGSEWEVYARAYAIRGFLPDEPWAIRPFSPGVLDRYAAAMPAQNPWAARLPQRTAPETGFHWLRSSGEVSMNSAYAWGFNDGPVWQGKGLNAWATVGGTWRLGHFSARFEPLVEYAENSPFQLEAVAPGATSPYQDPVEPRNIDLPQRMGAGGYHLINPGQSYVRFDVRSFGAGFSTEDLFWGPGVRNALLFGPNASGFPHVFFGTNRAVSTPVGRFGGQVIYGRLQESNWAPPNRGAARLGAGLIATWQPPRTPITIGLTRFFHRAWPAHFSGQDYTLPFGAFFSGPGATGTGAVDNQLASVFFSARAKQFGLDVYGEFGKNDRNSGVRDIIVEPEHASAWLVGFMKVIGLDPGETDFWTFRMEMADGRIDALQQLGRPEPTFYDHSPITQGHTELGQLLGTPLIERSGGADVALDYFSASGRLGVELMERQMPPDRSVGMPANQLRSQWDLGIGGTLFRGKSDLTFQVGRVWDFNRFPGQDVGNYYVRLGTRIGGRP
jgi:hypothetical protein